MQDAAAAAAIVCGEPDAPSGMDHLMARARLRSALAAQHTSGAGAAAWSAGVAVPPRMLRAAALAAAVVLAWAAGPALFGGLAGGTSGALPIAALTPGATWDVSAADLCAGTRHTRAITPEMRAGVLAAYGMEAVPPDEYELDYLVTPELGGATDPRNLWPQRYGSRVWNARVKDELERLLPELVCSRKLDLQTAQRDIAVDWVGAYKKYFETDRPLRAHVGPDVDDDDDVHDLVLAGAGPPPAVRLVSWAAR